MTAALAHRGKLDGTPEVTASTTGTTTRPWPIERRNNGGSKLVK